MGTFHETSAHRRERIGRVTIMIAIPRTVRQRLASEPSSGPNQSSAVTGKCNSLQNIPKFSDGGEREAQELSAQEFAARIGISVRTLYRRLKEPGVPKSHRSTRRKNYKFSKAEFWYDFEVELAVLNLRGRYVRAKQKPRSLDQ